MLTARSILITRSAHLRFLPSVAAAITDDTQTRRCDSLRVVWFFFFIKLMGNLSAGWWTRTNCQQTETLSYADMALKSTQMYRLHLHSSVAYFNLFDDRLCLSWANYETCAVIHNSLNPRSARQLAAFSRGANGKWQMFRELRLDNLCNDLIRFANSIYLSTKGLFKGDLGGMYLKMCRTFITRKVFQLLIIHNLIAPHL